MSGSDGPRLMVARRLRKARELAGLTQEQVAHLMGLHRPSISEIEAGRRRVSAEELKQFGTHYRVSLAWLAGERPESIDSSDPRVRLAARELEKLRPEDLERLLRLISALRMPDEDDE
jgi:transcriptional regulator with XRE-family HTH domain